MVRSIQEVNKGFAVIHGLVVRSHDVLGLRKCMYNNFNQSYRYKRSTDHTGNNKSLQPLHNELLILI